MLKILLWFVANDFRFLKDALKILERQQGGLELIGSATGENISKVDTEDVDILLVVGAREFNMSGVTDAAREFKIPEEKLLGDWIVCIPGFTLEKYRQLQRSRLSIFSRNCFGGCISNLLGLQFRSPFVNLFLGGTDFVKFLHAPRIYLAKEPTFEKLDGTSKEAPDGYPVLSLGNILLNMMHYKNPDEAIAKWNERKQRINWQNLFVTMYTDSEETAREFDSLPFEKKVCFVQFKSDLNSAWYINPEADKAAPCLRDRMDNFGWGKIFYYDLFDMLLYGKKTPLIEM